MKINQITFEDLEKLKDNLHMQETINNAKKNLNKKDFHLEITWRYSTKGFYREGFCPRIKNKKLISFLINEFEKMINEENDIALSKIKLEKEKAINRSKKK